MSETEKRKDGGLALPYPTIERITIESKDGNVTQEGMAWRPGNCSMLDLFAAAALQGQLAAVTVKSGQVIIEAAKSNEEDADQYLARISYDVAEAMLAERERRMV